MTEPILPAYRRIKLYRAIAKGCRGVDGAEAVRRAAIQMAWEARAEWNEQIRQEALRLIERVRKESAE